MFQVLCTVRTIKIAGSSASPVLCIRSYKQPSLLSQNHVVVTFKHVLEIVDKIIISLHIIMINNIYENSNHYLSWYRFYM